MPVVAVVGATGRQGSSVVRHLLHGGWQVRALTRRPDRPAARRLAAQGADVVHVDTEQPETLVAAFVDADGVFNVQNPMTSSHKAELRQGQNVADAAARAGVGHVVYGAAGVGDQPTGVPSWDAKLTIAARFREHGLPLTVLKPMAFMELMSDRGFYPPLAMWGLMPKLAGADTPIGWLSCDDVGAIAAAAFADPDRWTGATLSLASDVRSIAECRDIWREVRGRRPRGVALPTWLFERMAGTDLTTMWRWLGDNPLSPDTARTREILPSAVSVRDWAERRAARRAGS